MSYTIYDLAKDAGVSVTTVSRVINNSGPVSNKTKEKILNLIEINNYNPNPFARGLNNKSLNTIAVIINDITNPFFTSVVKGIDNICQENNINFILTTIENNPKKEREEIEILIRKNVDGFIFVGSRPSYDTNKGFLENLANKYKVVLVNSVIPGVNNLYSVYIDEYEASLEALDVLLKSKPKSIYFLGDRYWKTSNYKLKAYKKKLKEYEYKIKNDRILDCKYGYEDVSRAIDSINFENEEFPIAFFTSSDMIAISLIRILHNKNISIPKEASIMGYSNTPISSLFIPSISTVDQKMLELGEKSTKILIDLISNKKIYPKNFKVSHSIIKRETTL